MKSLWNVTIRSRCDADIDELERKYLTLYASMIEECGKVQSMNTYSIGLIRDDLMRT